MTTTIDDIIARWGSGDGKPYKGSLIDWDAYTAETDGGEGDAPIGCMCAQGQVLHLVAGWSPQKLRDTDQDSADVETARLLGISRAHAVLLRQINDSVDGAPAIVLTHPERVLGDQAPIVLAFWLHLDTLDAKGWAAAWNAAGDIAGDIAGAAAWNAAGDIAGAAAWNAAGVAAGVAARDTAENTAWAAAAGDTAWAAAGVAAGATMEIQGAALMRERGQAFYFLPLFGFADPEAVMAGVGK